MKNLIIISIALFIFDSSYAQNFTSEQFSQNLIHDINGAVCGAGLSFYDFNKDGWDDISFAQIDGSPLFYINIEGNFQDTVLVTDYFVEIKTVQWVDIDNDGDADLFITDKFGPSRLYENLGDLELVDISEASGIFQTGIYETYGGSWGDYNQDGYLDLYVANYNISLESSSNFLYKNNGDNTFEDVTEESATGDGPKPSFQGVWIDLNDDGLLDLYVINDRFNYENSFYENNGDGTFAEKGIEYGLDVLTDAMTNSFFDYDKDLDMDLFMTNSSNNNVMLENIDNVFEDVTFDVGVNIQYLSWCGQWMDMDNDSFVDLHVSTSYSGGVDGQNWAFRNNGDGTFSENNDAFPDNDTYQFCSAIGDYNNDGFVDLVGNNETDAFASLYKNTAEGPFNSITISLEGTVSNRDGIGAQIFVHIGSTTQRRFTFCGEDYLSQDSQRLIFGLKNLTSADSISVHWPSGHIDNFYDLTANQTYHFIEGSSLSLEISSSDNIQFCEGDSTTLNYTTELDSVLWNTDSDQPEINVTEAGEYWAVGYTELAVPVYSDTITVQVFSEPIIEASIQTVSCFGDSTGVIVLNNSSGSGLDTVIWSNGDIGLEIDSLFAGIYNYSFIDSNFCETEGSLEVTQTEPIIFSVISDSISCFEECDGEVEFSISGGIPDYSILGETNELCAGIYEYVLTDSNGCERDTLIEIFEPEALSVELEIQQISTDELGTATVNIEGGIEPYQILWSNDEEGIETIDLEPGLYTVFVEDANGCSVEANFEITTSILEFLESNLVISPIPADDQLSIESPIPWNTIQFYNANGKLILTKNSAREVIIDVNPYVNGIYFLSIQFEQLQIRKEILVQH